ncbi:MAG: type I-B CRISPR-associated endonuclease Cas1b [Akkermansia sp.]
MNLYLTRSGRLRRHDNTLRFEQITLPEEDDPDFEHTELENAPATPINVPVESIEAIYIFGEVSINSKLAIFLSQQEIPIHFFNYYGYHSSTLLPHAAQLSGNLVIKQVDAFQNTEKRITICRAILSATFHNISSILGYYQRHKGGLDSQLAQINEAKESLQRQSSPEQLMGVEGSIRNMYYQSWSTWMGDIATNFKREYHPPTNPLNALISFLNSLLYTSCVSELYRTALYPGISYLHSPQSRRYSLALDLVEPFKPIIVDRLLFRLWNTHSISDRDFRQHCNGFLLTDDARRKILQEWDQEMKTTVKIESLKRSVSYRQLLRLDCYKLVNFLLEERPYSPFKIKY